MFNGIIFNQGKINKIEKRKNGINLFLKSEIKLTSKKIGISVSCDGVCLTLISVKNKIFEFYLSNETIQRSKFKKSRVGDNINLELPLKYGHNISGHICQGHVDTVAIVNKIIKQDKSYIYDFIIKGRFKKYLIEKASVFVNGVSLTISKITKKGFQILAIPNTLKLTNLSNIKKSEITNIEIDILSKYINKFLHEKK